MSYLHLKLSNTQRLKNNPVFHNLLEIPECLEVNSTAFSFWCLYLYLSIDFMLGLIVLRSVFYNSDFLLFLCCKFLGISYIHIMYSEQIHSHFPLFPPLPYLHLHFSFPTLCSLFYKSTKWLICVLGCGASTAAFLAFGGIPWRQPTFPLQHSQTASSSSAMGGTPWGPSSLLEFRLSWSGTRHRRQLLLLWVLACNGPIVCGKFCFTVDVCLLPLDLIICCCFFSDPWTWGRSVRKMSYLELSMPQSLIFWVLTSYGGLYSSLSPAMSKPSKNGFL